MRLIDSCITQPKAQEPSRTCIERKSDDGAISHGTVEHRNEGSLSTLALSSQALSDCFQAPSSSVLKDYCKTASNLALNDHCQIQYRMRIVKPCNELSPPNSCLRRTCLLLCWNKYSPLLRYNQKFTQIFERHCLASPILNDGEQALSMGYSGAAMKLITCHPTIPLALTPPRQVHALSPHTGQHRHVLSEPGHLSVTISGGTLLCPYGQLP